MFALASGKINFMGRILEITLFQFFFSRDPVEEAKARERAPRRPAKARQGAETRNDAGLLA